MTKQTTTESHPNERAPLAADARLYAELAGSIADQAQAIKDGTVIGPMWSAVRRLRDNADMLLAWTPDHR